MKGATSSIVAAFSRPVVFQSTLPMKGATIDNILSHRHLSFQSTLPMKGATRELVNTNRSWMFQSTLPMKGATCHFFLLGCPKYVSIHAPNEGSDFLVDAEDATPECFNPRSQ